ncbi:MAG: hypothetical protein EZS28_041866, partial [Streblomastix strix]
SKFNSLEDQKAAQDLVSSFHGVLNKDASKVDMLNCTLEPFPRQKLFDEISWEGANVIFPMPEVGPVLPEEKAGYAWRALESSAAVVQGMAGLIYKVVQGDTDNLVGKMFKVFEASVVSVSDAQVERESRLEGVYQGPQTEDVLSQKTKERFKRKSAKQIKKNIFPESHISQLTHNTSYNLTPLLPTPHTQNLQLQNIIISQSRAIPYSDQKDQTSMHNRTQHRNPSHINQATKQKLCVGSMPPLTQRKMLREQDVGIRDPPILQQDVGIRDPPILQQIRMDQQSVEIRDLPTLQTSQNPIYINQGISLMKENRMKLKAQDNRIPQKQKRNMEQLIQESLYFPEANQLTDQETISRISDRVASTYPIGSLIDHSQTETCTTYLSSTGNGDQSIQIKSLLEEHQHPANIPIGGRLTHFVDAWKLIGADAVVTRGIKAFWINTQAPQILERNMTNPVKIRSKDSQLALGKLIEKELQEDIIEEVPLNQLKWINPCFAIPKSEPGKWRKIMD